MSVSRPASVLHVFFPFLRHLHHRCPCSRNTGFIYWVREWRTWRDGIGITSETSDEISYHSRPCAAGSSGLAPAVNWNNGEILRIGRLEKSSEGGSVFAKRFGLFGRDVWTY